MIFSEMSHLKQRVAMSLIALIFILFAIGLSLQPFFKPFFVIIVAAIVGGAIWEYCQIAKSKGLRPLDTLAIVVSTLFIMGVALATQYDGAHVWPQMVLGAGLLSFFLYYFIKGHDPFVNLAVTTFSLAYLAIPLSCLIGVNYFFSEEDTQDGRWWLTYLIAVTKMTDVGGYFFGKKFGGTKLAPYISPKKTWAGTYGGLAVAVATSVLFYVLLNLFFDPPPMNLTFWQSIVLGVLIGVVAQLGDLSESLLKRDVGVKDSSHLPGLGGVLDIVDSLVFTAPLVYIFLQMNQQRGLA
jgi:phosphatidate cytidylyltransferase